MTRYHIVAVFLALLFFSGAAHALQVVVNPSPITKTVTKTEPYTAFTATITLEENDNAAVVYITGANNTGIGIAGPTYVTSSGTYSYKLLVPNQPGTYTGNVKFLAVGTGQSYQVSFNVIVSSWEEKLEDYFEKGVMYELKLENHEYLLKIKDISDSAIQFYFDGATYTIAESESQVLLDNLKVEVVSVFSSGAVLKFYTNGESLSIAKYSAGSSEEPNLEGEDLSGFHFLITKYSKYIQRDMTYTITVTLVNDTDYRVYLKDVYFENTTVTDEGEKPTRLEDYQLPSYLDPGQELTLKVTIDTRGLDVGKTYTPTLVALGRVGSQDVRAQVDFYITVVKAVQTAEETKQTTEEQPPQQPQPTPSMPTQTLKRMIIEVVPPNPQPGDTVTIYVKDATTGEFVNANVTVNGEPTSIFEADWCKTYRIRATAEGYATATKTIKTKCKTLQVTYTPSTVKEGDEVIFQVVDADTGEPVQATISIDGKPLPGDRWTATPGTHRVLVRADGYNQKTITIKVNEVPPTPVGEVPEEVNVGEEVTIELTKKAMWEVYDENNVLLTSGESEVISFSPDTPGQYTIKVNGKPIATLTVKEVVEQTPSFQLPGNLLWWVAILGVVFIVYDAVRKKKRKSTGPEYPVGFELRPKAKFAMPLSEFEEQQQQQGGGSS